MSLAYKVNFTTINLTTRWLVQRKHVVLIMLFSYFFGNTYQIKGVTYGLENLNMRMFHNDLRQFVICNHDPLTPELAIKYNKTYIT